MQPTLTTTPPEPEQEPLKTEEQRKVNELFAQMTPIQRMNHACVDDGAAGRKGAMA